MLAIPRRVLVLDEPTAMLDADGRDEVLDAVRRLRAGGLTVVIVTQEMDEVGIADRVVALDARSVQLRWADCAELFARSDLVRRLRLGLPLAGEVALALAGRGRVAPRLPLTLDELATEYEAGGAGDGEQLWLQVGEEEPVQDAEVTGGGAPDARRRAASTASAAGSAAVHTAVGARRRRPA